MSTSLPPKPKKKNRLYDLLREAGFYVSDWSNYKRSESPASNPKYCYEWAFEDERCVALCLWYDHMQTEGDSVFQLQNYRDLARRSDFDANQQKRASRMDHAIQRAWRERLPVRVIVVDGDQRDDTGDTASHVNRRILDPMPWRVAKYNDNGDCQLVRGLPPGFTYSAPPANLRLARIAYNSEGWQRPTGEAADQESGETYNAKNRFGHEDWLFRDSWQIDGWRYAFIEGFNKGDGTTYAGQTLDVILYTIEPEKRKRLVAGIYGVEALKAREAEDAVKAFRDKGWFETMKREIRAIDGYDNALEKTEWAPHILNVRYRLENVDHYPEDSYLPDSDWLKDRHRYMLYHLDASTAKSIERSITSRRGSSDLPETKRLFRRGTKPVEYTPEHDKMQAKLMHELVAEYGEAAVTREQDYVDLRVETETERIYFEIKTDLSARAVLRQALGQILEYAYYPGRNGPKPDKLIIVGRSPLDEADRDYLEELRKRFLLPLHYRIVEI